MCHIQQPTTRAQFEVVTQKHAIALARSWRNKEITKVSLQLAVKGMPDNRS